MSKPFFTIAAYCCILSNICVAGVVDTKDWIKAHEGDYRIEKAGGMPPKGENALANVYADTDEGVLTMPFCREGETCNVGYLFLAYDKTKITERTLAAGGTRTTIEVQDAKGDRTYTWTETSGTFKFSNPHFVLDGKVITMEHEMVRSTP